MDLLLQILANGLLLGGLYALMALGLALVWGVLNIVNLAHGSFIMLGGYASYYLFTLLGVDPFATLPITALALFALGYALQRGVLNLVIRGPMFNTLLITFGLDVVLAYLAQFWFSADFRAINPAYAGDHFTPGNFRVDDGFAAVPPIVDHHNKVLHLRSGGRRSQRRISMPQIRNPSSVKF